MSPTPSPRPTRPKGPKVKGPCRSPSSLSSMPLSATAQSPTCSQAEAASVLQAPSQTWSPHWSPSRLASFEQQSQEKDQPQSQDDGQDRSQSQDHDQESRPTTSPPSRPSLAPPSSPVPPPLHPPFSTLLTFAARPGLVPPPGPVRSHSFTTGEKTQKVLSPKPHDASFLLRSGYWNSQDDLKRTHYGRESYSALPSLHLSSLSASLPLNAEVAPASALSLTSGHESTAGVDANAGPSSFPSPTARRFPSSWSRTYPSSFHDRNQERELEWSKTREERHQYHRQQQPPQYHNGPATHEQAPAARWFGRRPSSQPQLGSAYPSFSTDNQPYPALAPLPTAFWDQHRSPNLDQNSRGTPDSSNNNGKDINRGGRNNGDQKSEAGNCGHECTTAQRSAQTSNRALSDSSLSIVRDTILNDTRAPTESNLQQHQKPLAEGSVEIGGECRGGGGQGQASNSGWQMYTRAEDKLNLLQNRRRLQPQQAYSNPPFDPVRTSTHQLHSREFPFAAGNGRGFKHQQRYDSESLSFSNSQAHSQPPSPSRSFTYGGSSGGRVVSHLPRYCPPATVLESQSQFHLEHRPYALRPGFEHEWDTRRQTEGIEQPAQRDCRYPVTSTFAGGSTTPSVGAPGSAPGLARPWSDRAAVRFDARANDSGEGQNEIMGTANKKDKNEDAEYHQRPAKRARAGPGFGGKGRVDEGRQGEEERDWREACRLQGKRLRATDTRLNQPQSPFLSPHLAASSAPSSGPATWALTPLPGPEYRLPSSIGLSSRAHPHLRARSHTSSLSCSSSPAGSLKQDEEEEDEEGEEAESSRQRQNNLATSASASSQNQAKLGDQACQTHAPSQGVFRAQSPSQPQGQPQAHSQIRPGQERKRQHEQLNRRHLTDSIGELEDLLFRFHPTFNAQRLQGHNQKKSGLRFKKTETLRETYSQLKGAYELVYELERIVFEKERERKGGEEKGKGHARVEAEAQVPGRPDLGPRFSDEYNAWLVAKLRRCISDQEG